MFYVNVKRPIHLKGEFQKLYSEINKKFGFKHGIHLVKDGIIKCENGDIQYWEYFKLFDKLQTFIGKGWDDTSPIEMKDGKEFITINLYQDNELLVKRDMKVELHEVNYITSEEGGKYLLLCSYNCFYFQVIVRAE